MNSVGTATSSAAGSRPNEAGPVSATWLVLFAIALWSISAFLADRFKEVPPGLLAGIALTIGGAASAFRWRSWKVPWTTWLVGVGGIFGYYFLFVSAFHYAPAVEVNLVNYLWPLFIVLLTPVIFPGRRLRWQHKAGALLGLTGVALVCGNGHFRPEVGHLKGYLLAACAALVWAVYSLLSKRVRPFSSAAVGGFCLASGLLSLAIYFANPSHWQKTALPPPSQWVYLLLMGIGPLGAAFMAWDAALKRGDPRVIGCLANLTPLTSTLVLVIFANLPLTRTAAAGMILLMAAAVVGSLDNSSKNAGGPKGCLT